MRKLYVESSIAIDASPARVWDVLTRTEFTQKWAAAFNATGPIESNWTLGSEVLWRNAKGIVYVRGNVVAIDPPRLLRFTVCDALNVGMRPVSGVPDDEITQSYSLSDEGKGTILSTSHGDFGKLANGEQLYPLVAQLWEKLLPKIKELAEADMDRR